MTDDRLNRAQAHLGQAYDLMLMELRAEKETYELADAVSLTADALTQLRGEIRNREKFPRRYDWLGGAA
jgi:hypothetical protein